MAEQDDLLARARAAALGGKLRIEVFEHGGMHYAVRQSNTKMSRKTEGKKSTYDRLLISVVESLHVAVPSVGADGKQACDSFEEAVSVPVLDEEGRPTAEPVLDASGRPMIIDGKPVMRAAMQAAVGDDGAPVMRTVTVPRWELGPRVFGPEHLETLNEEPNDDDSLLGKAFVAIASVNDREKARARAKNP